MKKRLLIIALIICIVVVLAFSACKTEENWADELDLLKQVLDYIDAHYIEGLDIDQADVLAAAAVVGGLDKFSYLSDGNTTTELNAGIGILINVTPYREHIISAIIEGSPASEEKEGGFRLMRGDHIYAINGNRVEGLSSTAFQEFGYGGVGTVLDLTIKREGVILDTIYSYTKVKIRNTQEAEEDNPNTLYMPQAIYINNIGGAISEDIGYIKLRSFTGDAAKDFEQCINSFLEDGNSALILDLRGNSGGQSSILESIASYFVPLIDQNQRVILELDYKENGVDKQILVKVKQDRFLDIPLAIITDSSSASASEALIGAIRAFNPNEVAVIGQPTYGKGVFQNYPVELIDRRGEKTYALFISLVTGYYYIVDDRVEGGRYCIHNNPLVPDIFTERNVTLGELSEDNEIIATAAFFDED